MDVAALTARVTAAAPWNTENRASPPKLTMLPPCRPMARMAGANAALTVSAISSAPSRPRTWSLSVRAVKPEMSVNSSAPWMRSPWGRDRAGLRWGGRKLANRGSRWKPVPRLATAEIVAGEMSR